MLLAQPLRLGAMADEGKVDLSGVRLLVLDEADKLFDMGFTEQVGSARASASPRPPASKAQSASCGEQQDSLAC